MPGFGWQLNDAQIAAVATTTSATTLVRPLPLNEAEVRKARSQEATRTN